MDAMERERKLRAGKAKLAAYLKRKLVDPAVVSEVDDNPRKINKKGFDVDDSSDMVDEAEMIASGEHSHSSSISSASDASQRIEEYSLKLGEFQDALKQRDDVINQLTERLQLTITQHDQLQDEATAQADALVTEIEILKLQLQKANEFLQNQKGKNGISAQELLEAQNQAIALQQFVVQKDVIIQGLNSDAAEASHRLQEVRNELREKDVENERLREKVVAGENRTTLVTNNVVPDAEELQKLRHQLETVKAKSSSEVKQLMEDLEDMQKRLQHSQLSSKVAEERLESLRAELDEQYGLQIVEMKSEMSRCHREQIQLMNERLTSEKNALLAKTEDVEIWQEKLREAISEKESMEGEYKVRLDEANEQIRAFARDKEVHRNNLERLEKLLVERDEEAKIRIDLLTSEKDESETCRREMAEELQSLELEMDRLRNQRDQLERLCCGDDENLRRQRHLDCDISIDFGSIVAQVVELREENVALRNAQFDVVRGEKLVSTSQQGVQTLVSGEPPKDKFERLLREKLELEAELNKSQVQSSVGSSRVLVCQLNTAVADDGDDYEQLVDTLEEEDQRQTTSSLQAEVEELRLVNAHLQQDLDDIRARYDGLLSETGRNFTLDNNVLTTFRDRVENLMSELERRDQEYSKVVAELSMLKEGDDVEEQNRDVSALRSQLEMKGDDIERAAITVEKSAILRVGADWCGSDDETVTDIRTLQEKLLEAESANARLLIELSVSETKQRTLEDKLKTLTEEVDDPEVLQRMLSSRVDAVEKEAITVQRASLLGMSCNDDSADASNTLLRGELDGLKQQLLDSENSRTLLLQQLSASETKQRTLEDKLKTLTEELDDPEVLQRRLSSKVDAVEKEAITVQRASLLGIGCGNSVADSSRLELDALKQKLLDSENSRRLLLQQLRASEVTQKTLEDNLKTLTEELDDPEILQRRLSSRVDAVEKDAITVQRASLLGMGCGVDVTDTSGNPNPFQLELNALKQQLLDSESSRTLLLQQLSASETSQRILREELTAFSEELDDPIMLQRRLSSRVDAIEKEGITVQRASLLGIDGINGVAEASDTSLQQQLDALQQQLLDSETSRTLLQQQLSASETNQKTLEDKLKTLTEELCDPEMLKRRLSSRVAAVEKESVTVQRTSLLGTSCSNNVHDISEASLQVDFEIVMQQLLESQSLIANLQEELVAHKANQMVLEEEVRGMKHNLDDTEYLRSRLAFRINDDISLLDMDCDTKMDIDTLNEKRKDLEVIVKELNWQLHDPETLRKRLVACVDQVEKSELRVQDAFVLGLRNEDSSRSAKCVGDSAFEEEIEKLNSLLQSASQNDGIQNSEELVSSEKAIAKVFLDELTSTPKSAGDAPLTVMVVKDGKDPGQPASDPRGQLAEHGADPIMCECDFRRSGRRSRSLLDFECQVNMEFVLDDIATVTTKKALEDASSPDRDLLEAKLELELEFVNRSRASENDLKRTFETERDALLAELRRTKEILAECETKLSAFEERSLDVESERLISETQRWQEKETAIRKELQTRYDDDVERVRQCLEESLVTDAQAGVEAEVFELKERVEANIAARNEENDRLSKELDELKVQLEQLQRDKRRLERSLTIGEFSSADDVDVEFDGPDVSASGYDLRGGEDGVYLQLLTNITSICLNLAKSIDKEFVTLLGESTVEGKSVEDAETKEPYSMIPSQPEDFNESAAGAQDDSFVSLLSSDRHGSPLPGLENSLGDIVNEAGNRLSNAVSRLLDLFRESVQQLQESHVVQDQLANSSLQSNDEVASLNVQNEDLVAQLKEEEQTKDCLAVELHKISGLLKTCEVEKSELEESLECKERQLEQVTSQLDDVRARNRSLEESLAEEQQRRNLRREVVAEGLGEDVQLVHSTWNDPNVHVMDTEDEELLEENSRLHMEKRGLQYHSEKDRNHLTSRIQELEQLVEEMSTNHDRTLETKRREIEDLRQQIDALEKQLKAYKQFVEEQTAEREQEREEFQNELAKLNDVMREKEKGLSSGAQLTREVESLAEQLKEKDLLLRHTVERRDQLERDVLVLNDKLNTSQEVLRELERQLDCKSRNEHDLKEEMDDLKLALSNSARVHDEQCQEIEELRNASMSAHNRTLGSIPFLDEYMNENGLDPTNASSGESLMVELRSQMHTLEDKVGRHIRDLEALQLTSSSLSSPCSEEVSVREQLEALRSQGRPAVSQLESISGVPVEPSFSAYMKDVHRLDDRIESMTRAKEIAMKKMKDLDAQLQKQKHIEEDLLQDREVLQKQLNAQLVTISALQARIEEQRLRVRGVEPVEKLHTVQEELDKQNLAAEQLSKKVDDLQEQLNSAQSVAQGYELQIHGLMKRYTSETNQSISEKAAARRELDDLRTQVEIYKAKFDESETQSNDLSSLLQTVIQEKNQELDMMAAEVKRLEKDSDQQMEADSKNKGLLLELSGTVMSQKEELQVLQKTSDALREKLSENESESKELSKLLIVKERELRRATDTVDQKRREVDALKVVLEEKAQLVEQVQMLQSELHNLNNYQTRLQEDFDTVQSMLEDKQAELATVVQEMAEIQSSRDVSLEEQCNTKNQLEALRKHIADRIASLVDASIQVEIGNDELQALEQHHNLLESKCLAYEHDLAAVEKRQADFEFRLQSERQATLEASVELARTAEELVSTKAEVGSLSAKMVEVREEVESLEFRLTSANGELTETTQLKTRLEAEVAWRNNKIFRLEDEVEHLKTVVANEGGGSQAAVHKFLEEVQKELLSEGVSSIDRGQTSAEVSTSESEADSSSVMEGLPPRVRTLVKKIYEEGVSVLNLSEIRSVQEHSSAEQNGDALRNAVIKKSWENERRHLIAEIHALKDLLSRLTSLVGSSRDQLPLNASWLPQLLLAVANLITKENNLLMATVQSSVASSRHTNENDVQKLEIGISEMNRFFKNLLQIVQQLTSSVESDVTTSGEPKSKSWELQIAVARERLKHQEEQKKLMQDLRELDYQMGQNERRFKRQMELLKFRVQQEELIAEDLRHSLELEKSHCIELCGQCTREKGRAAHLELATAQLRSEVANFHATAEQLRQELKNITQQYKTEKARSETLLQSLQDERDSFAQLQEAMEAEKRRAKTSYQREQQIIEELRNALETERVKQLEMTSALERERLALHSARLDLKTQGGNVDRNLNACLSDDGKLRRKPSSEHSNGGHSKTNRVVEDVQDALDMERQKNHDLGAVLQREHRRVTSLTSSLSQERRELLQELDAERTNVVQLQCKLEVAQNQKANLSGELQRSQEHASRLEAEQERLIADASLARAELQQRDQEVDALRQIQQDLHKDFEVDREQERHKQHDLRLTIQKLQQRITFLEKELEFSKQSEGNLQRELDDERLNRPTSHNMLLRSTTLDKASRFQQSGVETIRQQLLLLLCKVKDELLPNFGGVDFLPDAIDNLVADVGKLCQQMLFSSQSEDEFTNNHLCLTERIVKHNSELAEFARRLCEEKLQLRVALSKASCRDVESPSPAHHSQLTTGDQVLVAERATWAQERAGLQRALHRAEAELLRNVGVSRQSSSRLAIVSSRNLMDDSKATHFYYKYLRAQSFRKNLIYQKGYLLDMLAGYQDTETATLDMLGRLGCLDDERLGRDRMRPNDRKAVNRFRGAAHVVVAVTRMRFLASKWKRVKHSLCPNNSTLHPRSTDVELMSPCPPSHSMYPTFTPPVRDTQTLQFDSDRSSSSTARRSLSLNTDSSYSSTQSLAALGEYVQRFENLQQQLGIGFPDVEQTTNPNRTIQ